MSASAPRVHHDESRLRTMLLGCQAFDWPGRIIKKWIESWRIGMAIRNGNRAPGDRRIRDARPGDRAPSSRARFAVAFFRAVPEGWSWSRSRRRNAEARRLSRPPRKGRRRGGAALGWAESWFMGRGAGVALGDPVGPVSPVGVAGGVLDGRPLVVGGGVLLRHGVAPFGRAPPAAMAGASAAGEACARPGRRGRGRTGFMGGEGPSARRSPASCHAA